MPSFSPSRHGRAVADALVFLIFLVVPLAVSPRFLAPFTSVKWYVLAAAAAVWLLVERLLCGSRGLPPFVRRTWPGWVVLGGLVIAGSLRKGPGWAMEPLLARGTLVTLTLAAFWYFRRTQLRLDAVRAAVLVAAALVVVLGLVQLSGLEPLPLLTTGDHGSSTFGNVNMTAQFVGLSIVVLLAGKSRTAGDGLAAELVAGSGVAYVGLVGSRSVTLALTVALLALALLRRLRPGGLLRVGAVALVVAAAVLGAAPPGTGLLDPAALASKQLSAHLRFAVWSDTLGLIRDHPMGVGAGSFEHEFIPYALAGRSHPGEAVVYRSPHNEYLRLVAEEGVVGATLLLALVALMVRGLHRSPALLRWRSDPGALLAAAGAFLGVEMLFQFPFELAYPTLIVAVLSGLALASIGEASAGSALRSETSTPWLRRLETAACCALALAIGVGLLRAAVADHLCVSRGSEVVALERACGLDPRRVEACVQAAWLRSRAGEHGAARQTLDALLRRSPHYFPAIKLLGEDLLFAGELVAGCRRLRQYDEMFRGRSAAHERVRQSCRGVLNPVSGDPAPGAAPVSMGR